MKMKMSQERRVVPPDTEAVLLAFANRSNNARELTGPRVGMYAA